MFPVFGQELYLKETLRAAEVIAECPERDHREAIEALLPQTSASTRGRIAGKLLQRLEGGCAGAAGPEPLARCLAGLRDSQARRELVYHAAARTDRLIGALARDVLYPALVAGRPPRGLSESDFAARNTGLLFTVEPLVSLPFAVWYARTRWRFGSARTVALALRVVRQAGLLLTSTLRGASTRTLTYSLAPHGITLPAFVWSLYDEASESLEPPMADAVERADFIKEFLVPASVAAARLREAERHGLVRLEPVPGGRRVALVTERDELPAKLAGVE